MTAERAKMPRRPATTPRVGPATGNEIAAEIDDAQQNEPPRVEGAGTLALAELSALDPHELALLATLGC